MKKQSHITELPSEIRRKMNSKQFINSVLRNAIEIWAIQRTEYIGLMMPSLKLMIIKKR